MKTLVLGLGNDLFGDDGVGLEVVKRLRKECLNDMDSSDSIATPLGPVDLVASTCTGLAILDLILGYDRLFIIDTIKQPHPQTGRVRVLKEKDLRAVPGPSPHYVSFNQVLEIGRAAGLPVPQELTIIAVEAKDIYHLGEALSPEMKASLPGIIKHIKSILGLETNSDESQRNHRS